MSANKIFLALPIYGAVPAQFMQCMIRLSQAAKPPCQIKIRQLNGDSLVARARNTLTADFLASDCSHLMFVDSDLVFNVDQIGRLLKRDVPLIGGLYPKKQEGDLRWVMNALEGEPEEVGQGLVQVKYIGTGFMLISRSVFEKMITFFGDRIQYKEDSTGRIEHDFWSTGVYQFPDGTRRYLSEDWFFCQRWLDLGGAVWADTSVILQHIGQAVYPLQSQEEQMLTPGKATRPTIPSGAGVPPLTPFAPVKDSVPVPV
jgi:hypothetical protein